MTNSCLVAGVIASFPGLPNDDREGGPRLDLTPLQQFLLLCGLAGIVLGFLLVLAGLHELAHRDRTAGHGQPAETDALGQRTRPLRW
jgi:hypothetical protein